MQTMKRETQGLSEEKETKYTYTNTEAKRFLYPGKCPEA